MYHPHLYITTANFIPHRQLLAPDGVWLKEGDTIYRKKYAQTLRAIGASGSASYFYEGQFMKDMVQELKRNGAILEEEDFMGYNATERELVQSEFNGLKVIGVSPPSSGAVLALILNILQGKMWQIINSHVICLQYFIGYNFTEKEFGSLAYHRIVESFKFAFGQRLRLGDPAYNDTIHEVCCSYKSQI